MIIIIMTAIIIKTETKYPVVTLFFKARSFHRCYNIFFIQVKNKQRYDFLDNEKITIIFKYKKIITSSLVDKI
jgi:hypothetical protein